MSSKLRLLSPAVLDSCDAFKTQFQTAKPFRHLVMDGFFDKEYAEQLLAQFPPFEKGNARNENGELGNKSVVERIRELGDAYARLDDLVSSREFLDWLSAATGIPDLRYDPWYFGGGTHENRHGQDLDPHVDFNRHPENGWHRRLNLIVYLNHDWDDSWGGSLELHQNPRAEDNQISLVTPLFNRGVVFETTEWSWHGFGRIQLPEDKRHLSRRSIALYFYTLTRPTEELAPHHSTIYVDRPLPERFKPGMVLTEADLEEIKVLLARRDRHNQRLYDEVCRLTALVSSDAGTGHLGRFINGCRHLFGSREGSFSQRVKISFMPFVTHLPSYLRNPLRRFWRKLAGRAVSE